MSYLTVKQTPAVRQMTLEELLFSKSIKQLVFNTSGTNTKTYKFKNIPCKYFYGINFNKMAKAFKDYNEKYDYLRGVDREKLYYTFYIPKASGGLRRIDAPNEELKEALRELKNILEVTCGALYHTTAFAYIKKRCTKDALIRHQRNESRWYGKLDLSNFFGSTTFDFAMSMLSNVFPFSELMQWRETKMEIEKAIELGFLNGGLPQGTPLSPTLTNIIMIPIDFEFNKILRNAYESNHFVCTRYADDFIISSKYDFDINAICNTLRDVMGSFNAPYIIKDEKTRYGSIAGQNWNLGLMINAENEITVGHKRKREFKAMLSNFILDTKNGKLWELNDVQVLEGLRAYYSSVEQEKIDEIVANLNAKYDVNVVELIKSQIASCAVR